MFVSCHSGDDQVYSAVLFITTWPLVVVVLVIIHAVTKWTPLWVANGDHLKVVGGEDGPAPVESYLFPRVLAALGAAINWRVCSSLVGGLWGVLVQ